jgi:hypothetical protein
LNLKKYSDEDLLVMWETSGKSQRALALELGVNFNKLHGRIFRAQKRSNTLEDEKAHYTENGNRATATMRSERVKTVEDLIEECQIDLDIWKVEKAEVNTWEGYRREEDKDLTYVDGKATGYIKDQGKLNVRTLYQVRVKLIRKEPIALSPVVSPIAINIPKSEGRPIKKLGVEKTIILMDPHFGFRRDLKTGDLENFQDRSTLNMILDILASVHFDTIVVGVDVLDLAEWSDKFLRSPDMFMTTQAAVIEAAWWLGKIRERQPHAKIHFIEGNHEVRLTNALMKHAFYSYELRAADELEGPPLMSVPKLLGLSGLNIEYVGNYPNGKVWISSETVVVHGSTARGKSGHTASAIVDGSTHNEIFGHIHRREMASKTLYGKDGARSITAMAPGCLCRIGGTVPGNTAKENWQQGFGVIYHGKIDNIHIVPIEKGALFEDAYYSAEDYKDQLIKDTDWRF